MILWGFDGVGFGGTEESFIARDGDWEISNCTKDSMPLNKAC